MTTGTEEGKGASSLVPGGYAGTSAEALNIPAVVWLSEQGVEVRFASGLGDSSGGSAPYEHVVVSPGTGKTGVQIADTGVAMVVAWHEMSADGYGFLKLRGVSAEAGVLGSEITIGDSSSGLSHHSLFINGYNLGSDAANGADAAGVNLVWVASEETDAAGTGRIMLQRYAVALNENGTASELVPLYMTQQAGTAFAKIASAPDASFGAANDNAVWVGQEDDLGAIGSSPTVASLQNGDVLVAWIGAEGHVHGKLYAPDGAEAGPDPSYAAVNSALADLTPEFGRYDGHEFDARRVRIAELGPGNFAIVWMVAAGTDAMLNGRVFSMPATEAANPEPAQADIAPIPLPGGFAGNFNLDRLVSGGPELVVSYEVEGENGSFSTKVVTQKIALPEMPHGNDNPLSAVELPAGNLHTNGHLAGSGIAQLDGNISLNVDTTALSNTALPHPSAVTDPVVAIKEAGLIVTTNAEGTVVAWTVPGADPDSVGIRLQIVDQEGRPAADTDGKPVTIDVTDRADPDVAPAVTHIGGDEAVAAWVDKPSGELRTQSYSSHGAAHGPTGGIAVSSGHKVSDLTVASHPAAHHSAAPAASPDAAAPETSDQDQFAVAWVQDADHDGYGSIMLQRYSVADDTGGASTSHAPVALGRDGHAGDNDAAEPFQVDSGEGPAPVVGRAPQMVGLHDGQLAVSWVESAGSGETVKGAVIERDGGRQVLSFDLSTQLDDPAVLAKGTEPILSAAVNDDILIAWMESDGKGGFDVKAALYKSAGEDAWSVPEKVIDLHHFNSEPRDFSAALTGDDDPSILVTWEDKSGSSHPQGQYFDLDGDALGQAFRIRDNGSADDYSDTASLPDGRIVVVYAEKNTNGSVDIESHIVDSTNANTGDSTPPVSDSSDHIFADRGALDTYAGLGDYASLTSSQYGPLASDKDITVVEDATDGVIIDVLDDQNDAGLRVVQVNGHDIEIGSPQRIEHGFIQLRDDGDLLFTADEDFHGTVNFEYTVQNEDDRLATASVAINVTPVDDDPMPVDLAFDQAADDASSQPPVSPFDGVLGGTSAPDDASTQVNGPDYGSASGSEISSSWSGSASSGGGDTDYQVAGDQEDSGSHRGPGSGEDRDGDYDDASNSGPGSGDDRVSYRSSDDGSNSGPGSGDDRVSYRSGDDGSNSGTGSGDDRGSSHGGDDSSNRGPGSDDDRAAAYSTNADAGSSSGPGSGDGDSSHRADTGEGADQAASYVAAAADAATAAPESDEAEDDTITVASGYDGSTRSVERQWLTLDTSGQGSWDDDRGGHHGNGGYDATGDNDTFVFHAAFGNDASEGSGPEHVIDLSNSGYPTFQALQDSGALVQVGDNVEITLNHVDPAHPEKILLRSVSLSDLSASDFKFG